MKIFKFIVPLLFFPKFLIAQKINLTPHLITLKNGLSFNLHIPEKYSINPAFEGLNRVRFMQKSPDGKLFVTDMYNRSDNKKGSIYYFEDYNEQTHVFSNKKTVLSNLHNPNQCLFVTENGIRYFLVAETDKLTRYNYTTANQPLTNAKVIATFPDYGLSYKYGGWHLTRSLAYNNKKLYVSVGSSCNACIETEEIRATIIQMNIDGTDVKHFANGIRNAVGINFVQDKLWATNMGRDLLGPDKPEDQLLQINENDFGGWPYFFEYKKQILNDKYFKDSMKNKRIAKPLRSYIGFKAHTAPLGFCYVTNFSDTTINNSFLVALHGSTTVSRNRGNEIVLVNNKNNYFPLVTGFLQGKTEDKRFGRPADVMVWNNNTILITDDKNGVIYALNNSKKN